MRTFFAFLISSILLILVDFLGWSRPIKAWVEEQTAPIQRQLYDRISNFEFRISNFIDQSPQKITALEKKLAELERENENLKINNRELDLENNHSRRLLAAPLAPEWSFLPARVLGSNRYLLIDKGRRDAVEPGLIAIFEKTLVGQVVAVGERTAKIRLLIDQESKIQVKTLPKWTSIDTSVAAGRIKGIVVGTGEALLLTEVPQADKFQVGDLVVTSGAEEIFPPNLLIGKVASISQDERQPFQQAEIEPLLDYSQLETVFLVL